MTPRGEQAVAVVKVLQRGQLTLPKAIRDRVGLAEGDDLLVYVNGEGQIVLNPLPRPRSLRELSDLIKLDQPIDREAARRKVRAARARRWAEKHDGPQGPAGRTLADVAAALMDERGTRAEE